MIELRWHHDPTGKEVTKLQYRVHASYKEWVPEWQDVPHFWPTVEQHDKQGK